MPNSYRIVLFAALVLIALEILGGLFPSSLNWGSHFLGFIPGWTLYLYAVLAALVLYLSSRRNAERYVLRLSQRCEEKRAVFLSSISLLFVLSVIIFRVQASLLGDSYTLIYNFQDARIGIAPLAPWHEPLSVFTLFHAVNFFGASTYPEIYRSFLIAQTIFGAGFIVCLYASVSLIWEKPEERIPAFLLLVISPYMEFFLGYIETYAVSTFCIGLFILVSLLVLRGRLPLAAASVTYVAVTFSHYVNGLLGISLLYLAYQAYRRQSMKEIIVGIAAPAVLVLGVFAATGFHIDHLIDSSPVSHFLSFTSDISPYNAYSQPFTIFSVYHFLDLLNYLVLMAPFAASAFVFVFIRRPRQLFSGDPVMTWCSLTVIPFGIYLLLAKLEQGTASDWDVFAAQFVFLNLWAAMAFFKNVSGTAARAGILIVVLGVTLLNSLAYFSVNAGRDSSIRRFQTLWDKRTLSHLGRYTMALRLSRYYGSVNDSASQVSTWEEYTHDYPDDPRGYQNAIAALRIFYPAAHERQTATYRRWLNTDPANDTLRQEYAALCLEDGNIAFRQNDLAAAKRHYEMAIEAMPSKARAYNNLGSVYAQEKDLDHAIGLFHKAISLDSVYADAWYNLSTAYADKGNLSASKIYLRKAAKLGNGLAKREIRN